MKDQVWFVTGSSTGFGKALAKELLAQGYKVAATARKLSALADLGDDSDQLVKLRLDVTDPQQIATAVAAATDAFGKIDVLVNNAGYGYFGSIEESDQAQVRDMMATNFWGANDMTLAVLPLMRQARSGHIINVTSIGGLATFPAFAYYHATKFAMEGLFQSLAKQVAPFGIHVTNVEPGGFRTDWAGRSHFGATATIDDYQAVHEAQDAAAARSGQQMGDPKLAAKAFIKLTQMKHPPVHYLFGADAYETATATYKAALAEFEAYQADSTHLGYSDADQDYWK